MDVTLADVCLWSYRRPLVRPGSSQPTKLWSKWSDCFKCPHYGFVSYTEKGNNYADRLINSLVLDQNVPSLQIFQAPIQILQKQSSDTCISFCPPVPRPTETPNGTALPFFDALAACHSLAHRASKCAVDSTVLLNSFSPFEPEVMSCEKAHLQRGLPWDEAPLLFCPRF